MSNPNYEKIQSYLDDCEQSIFVPAIRNGLDSECYYRYLVELSCALPKDYPQLEELKLARDEMGRQTFEHDVNLTTATMWVFSSTGIFTKQLDVLAKLMNMIELHSGDDSIEVILEAQKQYVIHMLWSQRRVLDTILAWAPSSMLAKCNTSSTQEYADVLCLYDKVGSRARAMIQRDKDAKEVN